MEAWHIIYLMFLHYVADFWLQSEVEAKNKSSSINFLIQHIFTYSLIMSAFSFVVFLHIQITILPMLLFGLLCFVFHGLTDFVTSKLTRVQYKKNKFYGTTGFFSIIGLDQFLHFVQIYLSYLFIIKLFS